MWWDQPSWTTFKIKTCTSSLVHYFNTAGDLYSICHDGCVSYSLHGSSLVHTVHRVPIFVSLLPIYLWTSVAAPNLPKMTAGFGLLAWLGVFLASAGLVMFYRCSRYILWHGLLLSFFFPKSLLGHCGLDNFFMDTSCLFISL